MAKDAFGIVLLAVVMSTPTHAQYKCTQQNGGTVFQQTPCPVGSDQEKLRLFDNAPGGPPSAVPDPRRQLRQREHERHMQVEEAIRAGRPMVSMTAAELARALGNPDKINAAQYGARFQDQLVYHRGDRTLYVHLEDGVVTAIQNQEGMAGASSLRQRRCPTAAEIRSIEIEISRIANRGNDPLQVELHRQLNDARSCR